MCTQKEFLNFIKLNYADLIKAYPYYLRDDGWTGFNSGYFAIEISNFWTKDSDLYGNGAYIKVKSKKSGFYEEGTNLYIPLKKDKFIPIASIFLKLTRKKYESLEKYENL